MERLCWGIWTNVMSHHLHHCAERYLSMLKIIGCYMEPRALTTRHLERSKHVEGGAADSRVLVSLLWPLELLIQASLLHCAPCLQKWLSLLPAGFQLVLWQLDSLANLRPLAWSLFLFLDNVCDCSRCPDSLQRRAKAAPEFTLSLCCSEDDALFFPSRL